MKRAILVIGIAFSLVASAIAFASTGFTVAPGDCLAFEKVEMPYTLSALDVAAESSIALSADTFNPIELAEFKRRSVNTVELIAQSKPLPGTAIYEVGWRYKHNF